MAFNKPKAHERAERYAAKGQHDKAAREYQQIVEHDPKDIRAWLMLADCLARCGDKPGAIERYERVGKYYVDAKEPNKALAVYRQVLNLDPQRLDIQTRVAALHLGLGNLPDAVALYERIGHAQMQLGRIGDALATYKIVADADPTAVAKRLRLAELYSREKRTAEAVEAFRVAGQALLKIQRVGDYVRVAERLLFHDGKDLPTIRQLARAYLDLNDPRRALMKLNGLLRNNSADEEGIELLAETFMALGKPEKALSALEELARALRAKGPEAKDATIRILRRGLEWRPAHAEFREALAELEGRRSGPAAAAEDESQEVEVDDLGLETLDEDDLVELDDDDLVLEEPTGTDDDQVSVVTPTEESAPVDLPQRISPAPGTRPTTEITAAPPPEATLTQSVLSEVEGPMPEAEGLTDFDKILFEARVYIKYRLFEHALDHVQTALAQQPEHVGALSLQARALTELGRSGEAAGAHVRVAELVLPSDPKLAREHLGAAQSLEPDHPAIPALLEQAISGEQTGPTPVAVPDDEGDSGAFDLVSEGLEDFVADVAARAHATSAEPDAEPAANLVDAHELEVDEESVDGESTQPFTPIDVSDFDSDEPELELDLEPARTGRTLAQHLGPEEGLDPELLAVARGQRPEGAPTAAIELDPEHTDVLVAGFEDLEIDLDVPAEPDIAIDSGDEFSLEDDSSQDPGPSLRIRLEPEPEPALDLPIEIEASPELELEPADTHEVVAEPEPVSEPPAPALAPPGGWPDLSDDLAEVRFYLDQGLDEDADAALDDLEERYPGHPELAAFRGGGTPPAEPVMVEADAAAPLVDVDEAASEPLMSFDEDEDEDDYLSAIFADPGESKAQPAPSAGAGANVAEGQSVDPETAFDLGVAYREMGLVDAAITQFETAAADLQWRARALTMLGTLRVHQGQTELAITNLQEALNLAVDGNEASEAAYELGVLFEMLGDVPAAIDQLRSVTPGYRDRDDRLAALGG